MQFTNVILAIMASAVMVSAAPAESGAGLFARACPDGYNFCGECNGSSCKIAGINYSCDVGKCTAQSGGGDGKICGYPTNDGSNIHCPGSG